MTNEVYQPDVRKISGQVAVVRRRLPYTRIPWRQVPVADRRGLLQIYYQWDVAIRGNDQTGDVYAHGCIWESRGGYGTWVEVVPRTWDRERCVQALKRGLPEMGHEHGMRLLDTRHCNVVVPAETGYFVDGVTAGRSHVTFMPPGRLKRYLVEALPFIGVAPQDVNQVVVYLEVMLVRAGREHGARLRAGK